MESIVINSIRFTKNQKYFSVATSVGFWIYETESGIRIIERSNFKSVLIAHSILLKY